MAARPEEIQDPRGRKYYWISTSGAGEDAGEGTDFWAIQNKCVSITPLHVDMTHYESLDSLHQLCEELL